MDIPISNCLNSGIRSIYVLTQFNSMSLHRHINASYKFDNFTRALSRSWPLNRPRGFALVSRNCGCGPAKLARYFLERPVDYYIILER